MLRKIDAWLNDRLFSRPDLHTCFMNLDKCGADLEYILFACKFFCIGDQFRRFFHLDSRRGVLGVTSDYLERALKILEQGLSIGLPSAQLAYRDLDKALDKLDMSPFSLSGDLLVEVLQSFCFPTKFFNEKGDPGDRWGTFFLLMVTDHLRSTGKRKPNHVLAYKLLANLRKESLPITNPRQSVATRIKRLQTADPICVLMIKTLSCAFRENPDYCKGFVDFAPAHLEIPGMLNGIPGTQSI